MRSVSGAVNSLGQVVGVVIGGIIMIWSDHLAYWTVAGIFLVFAYLFLPEKILSVRKS